MSEKISEPEVLKKGEAIPLLETRKNSSTHVADLFKESKEALVESAIYKIAK